MDLAIAIRTGIVKGQHAVREGAAEAGRLGAGEGVAGKRGQGARRAARAGRLEDGLESE